MRGILAPLAIIAGIAIAGPTLADNDRGKGHGHDRRDDARGEADVQVRVSFGERERVVVRDYYVEAIRAGHCPPGLAKKHNGCEPPGHAKRWIVGRPLPREVIYYELPPPLVVRLPPPPPRYRYVRVDNDILLLALGTGVVIDAITNMGRN